MAKYESPWQILGLFLGAALVSIGVITFLRAEAGKRNWADQQGELATLNEDKLAAQAMVKLKVEDSEGTDMIEETDESSILTRLSSLKTSIRNFLHLNSDNAEIHSRKKRSLNDNEPEIMAEELPSLLFGEYQHKIRNIKDKVKLLDPRNQIVKAILTEFCPASSRPKLEEEKIPGKLEKKKENLLQEEEEDENGKLKNGLESDGELEGKSLKLNQSESHEHHHFVPPSLIQGAAIINHHPIRMPDHELACQSYGEMLIVVFITTLVNLLAFTLTLFCKHVVTGYNRRVLLQSTETPRYFRFPSSEVS